MYFGSYRENEETTTDMTICNNTLDKIICLFMVHNDITHKGNQKTFFSFLGGVGEGQYLHSQK